MVPPLIDLPNRATHIGRLVLNRLSEDLRLHSRAAHRHPSSRTDGRVRRLIIARDLTRLWAEEEVKDAAKGRVQTFIHIHSPNYLIHHNDCQLMV